MLNFDNMVSGTKPNKIDHEDFDFLKSHGFAGISTPTFPPELLTDANLWMPNQNTYNPDFKLQAEPYGCTNYTQADLASDLTGVLHNPLDLENITHANAKEGIDIRISLEAARKMGWIEAYYNIRPSRLIDAFSAIQLATISAQPEKRSVSWGTPWFPSWEQAVNMGQYIMPMPTVAELSVAHKDPGALPWHNSKLGVYKTINGIPYMRNKSWQGKDIGDKGWLYFPREVVNVVMGLSGTVAYTATNIKPTDVQTIDVNIVQLIFSYIRKLLGL